MDPILGAVAALILSMLGVAGFITFAQQGVTNVLTAATASQMVTFNKAAQRYITDNGATIAAAATPTVPVTISTAMLSAANYLPASYLTTNPFQQTWQVQVLQPSPGVLQSLVMSTGGRAISDTKQLVQIAAQAGAQGGFIPYANQAGDATMQPSSAYGAFGAWKVSLANYANPGAGHLASLLAFGNTQTNNNYLYRVAVPNRPELNNMQTDLGLTDTGGTAHNINGVNTVNAKQAQFSGTIGTNGFSPTQGLPPAWGGGLHTWDVYAEGSMAAGTGGQMKAGLNQTGAVWGQTLQPANIATGGQGCGSNGLIAANSDGSGQILSCQGGIWLPIGGRWLQMYKYDVWHGYGVPVPSCPSGGIPRVLVYPTNFTVDDTGTVNFGATQSGGQWIVYITDGVGTPIGGAAASAATFCAY